MLETMLVDHRSVDMHASSGVGNTDADSLIVRSLLLMSSSGIPRLIPITIHAHYVDNFTYQELFHNVIAKAHPAETT